MNPAPQHVHSHTYYDETARSYIRENSLCVEAHLDGTDLHTYSEDAPERVFLEQPMRAGFW